MQRQHLHIKKNDLVEVIAGQEKGKTGKITRVMIDRRKVVIEKLNRAKKHTKPTQKNPQGGIVEVEKPVDASNVLLVCPKCNKGVRTRRGESKGKTVRLCRKCGQAIDK